MVRSPRLVAARAPAGIAGKGSRRPLGALDCADRRRQDARRILPTLVELSSAAAALPAPSSPPALVSTGRGVQRSGGLHTLYISPLKALAVDIARNLEAPVSEMGLAIKVETRTGDTPVSRRQRQRRYPPDILLTTPEQLALLLSSMMRHSCLAHSGASCSTSCTRWSPQNAAIFCRSGWHGCGDWRRGCAPSDCRRPWRSRNRWRGFWCRTRDGDSGTAAIVVSGGAAVAIARAHQKPRQRLRLRHGRSRQADRRAAAAPVAKAGPVPRESRSPRFEFCRACNSSSTMRRCDRRTARAPRRPPSSNASCSGVVRRISGGECRCRCRRETGVRRCGSRSGPADPSRPPAARDYGQCRRRVPSAVRCRGCGGPGCAERRGLWKSSRRQRSSKQVWRSIRPGSAEIPPGSCRRRWERSTASSGRHGLFPTAPIDGCAATSRDAANHGTKAVRLSSAE